MKKIYKFAFGAENQQMCMDVGMTDAKRLGGSDGTEDNQTIYLNALVPAKNK